ncbi:hypothetical protein ACS0TY_018244 [Phlomoides rotata]
MSHAASSLRSHFIKHQKLFICAANLFSSHGGIHCLPPPPSHLSTFAAAHRLRRLNIAAVNFSTLAFSDDSYNSPYLSVNLSCPRHISDAFSESLICFGAGSITIDEQENHESDEQIWIRSTFNVDQDVKYCISQAANTVGLKEIPLYKVEMHDHTDWIKKSQESFQPVEITEGLWIVPEWRNPPDLQATNIILNPGLAFGTGEHPTTKLCLLLLHRLIKGGEHFLDYGTGSGVLAIAALKMGASLSVGFDIEPQAITSAQHNAALNNIGQEKLQLSLVPSKNEPQLESEGEYFLYNSEIVSQKDKYDVVIANILLHPLLDLADRIVSYAKPGATIGISGILSEQVQTVIEHYSQYLEDMNVSMVDGWACISGSKKKEPSKINLFQI